jgi:histidinol-phosphatase (PHP family)
VLEGLATGAYTYLAHPDMYAFNGDEAVFREEMTRLCQEVKALGLPIEVNMLGLADHRHYPSERFYRIAAEVGNEIIVGCDAHSPAALLDLESQRKTRAFAEQFGLRVVDTVSFRNI